MAERHMIDHPEKYQWLAKGVYRSNPKRETSICVYSPTRAGAEVEAKRLDWFHLISIVDVNNIENVTMQSTCDNSHTDEP